MAHIFAIDDALDLVMLVKDVLEAENHTVTIFTSAVEALERLKTVTPDIILVDVMMPVMDGYTFCTSLLEDPRLKDLPVVVLTSKGKTRDTFKALPNVVTFLEKPYNTVVLVHMIERALKKA